MRSIRKINNKELKQISGGADSKKTEQKKDPSNAAYEHCMMQWYASTCIKYITNDNGEDVMVRTSCPNNCKK